MLLPLFSGVRVAYLQGLGYVISDADLQLSCRVGVSFFSLLLALLRPKNALSTPLAHSWGPWGSPSQVDHAGHTQVAQYDVSCGRLCLAPWTQG